METDHARSAAAVIFDAEGNPVNGLRLDNFEFTNEERMGKRLQEIARNTNTFGDYVRVGDIHSFPVSITSERVNKDGIEVIQNRFVVEGSYKYKYNNSYIAMSDTHATSMNFLNALERMKS